MTESVGFEAEDGRCRELPLKAAGVRLILKEVDAA
jgi:hypothetical protein